jgi:acetyltransferase
VEGAKILGMAADIGPKHQLCIQPYPAEYEEMIRVKGDKEVLVRPIRGEDEPELKTFHEELSIESIRYRFFTARRNFRHRDLALFAQIDYQQEMAFVAFNKDGEILGVVRTWTDADQLQAEFSILVADNAKGLGLGSTLMNKMIRYSTGKGTIEMKGTVLSDNTPMLKLANKLGFKVKRRLDGDVVEIRLPLNEITQEWQHLRLDELHKSKK